MKKMLMPGWLIAGLTGVLFSAYAAYNVFIIIRDSSRSLPSSGILISAVVALLFAVLAAFMWTAGMKEKKYAMFLAIRRVVFIVTLLVIFALKMRLVDRVAAYIDFSKLYTVLYAGSYFLTQAAFLILLIYYIFILKMLPFYPKASVVLPVIAAILFLCSFILDAILYFAYGMLLEGNVLRTVVMRPVFYLSFIGLSLHFVYPVRPE